MGSKIKFMKIDWTTIKNEIKLETRNILPKEPQLKIDEVLDLFIQVLQKSLRVFL